MTILRFSEDGPRDSRRHTSAKKLNPVANDKLTVRTARSRYDLFQAFGLIQRRYSEAGLAHSSCKNGLRVMPYQLEQSSQVFIAETRAGVIGSVTLVMNPQRLPIESHFGPELHSLRTTSAVAEIACLAVNPQSNAGPNAFAQLTRILVFFARAQGFSNVAAAVHPRHAKFYRQAMGFAQIGPVVAYESVGGQPAVPVIGSIVDATAYRRAWRRFYFEGPMDTKELAHRPVSREDQRFFQQLEAHDAGSKPIRAA